MKLYNGQRYGMSIMIPLYVIFFVVKTNPYRELLYCYYFLIKELYNSPRYGMSIMRPLYVIFFVVKTNPYRELLY